MCLKKALGSIPNGFQDYHNNSDQSSDKGAFLYEIFISEL